jgi:hypothetical protein
MPLAVNETPKCASCGEPAPGALPLAEVKDDDVRSAFCPLCKSLMQGHDEGIQEQSALTLHLVAEAARRRLSDDQIRYVVERALAGEDSPIGVPLDLAADPSRPAREPA